MYELFIHYLNYQGDDIRQSIPIFHSYEECDWWRTYLSMVYQNIHDSTLRYASCIYREPIGQDGYVFKNVFR